MKISQLQLERVSKDRIISQKRLELVEIELKAVKDERIAMMEKMVTLKEEWISMKEKMVTLKEEIVAMKEKMADMEENVE